MTIYPFCCGFVLRLFVTVASTTDLIKDANIELNLTHSITIVNKDYLSFAIDPNLVQEGWKNFDVKSNRLITLTRALSPSRFRFGGTAADFLIFNNTNSNPTPIHNINFTMTAQDLDGLNYFTNATHNRLLFCLNMLLRNGTSWDPDNAIKILKYAAKTNFAKQYDLELGNEPNHIQHHWGKPLDPVQLAKDFAYLQLIIKTSPELTSAFKNALFVGPDVTRPIVGINSFNSTAEKFLMKYLETISISKAKLDAITWHQYYVNSRTTTIYDFLSPKIFNLFSQQAKIIQYIVNKAGFQNTPIWMGETATAYGGGAAGLSDTYVAGFMWLDKLGLASKHGIKVVIRQSLYNGHYALLDNDLNPNTDFWLSYIFKLLVGKNVLNVTQDKYLKSLRTYAHCTDSENTNYPPGSITVFAMNLHEHVVKLHFNKNLKVDYCASYVLTPSEKGNLQSKFVDLNGKTLYMVQNNTLPPISPMILKKDSPFILPKKSYGFFVLAGEVSPVCVK